MNDKVPAILHGVASTATQLANNPTNERGKMMDAIQQVKRMKLELEFSEILLKDAIREKNNQENPPYGHARR